MQQVRSYYKGADVGGTCGEEGGGKRSSYYLLQRLLTKQSLRNNGWPRYIERGVSFFVSFLVVVA